MAAASSSSRLARRHAPFVALVRRLGRLVGGLRGRYRPERHYMRGPGPKWHARHAGGTEGALPG